MADTKISAAPAATTVAAGDQFPLAQSGASKSVTASVFRATYIGEGLSNASAVSQSGAYASDQYLAGSAITIPTAGGWRLGTIVRWVFDLTKTAAGVAAPLITVRMGTLGTTSDAQVYLFTFGAGTGVADTGTFDVSVIFRSVGSGTTAVLAGMARCTHHLAATGLTTTGASGVGIIVPGASAGFDSTTQTVIGLSLQFGAAFSGTNTFVTADADKA